MKVTIEGTVSSVKTLNFSVIIDILCYILVCFWTDGNCFSSAVATGKISGGGGGVVGTRPARGVWGLPPRKVLKSRGLEMLFPPFSKSYLWLTHIANYLLPTLSRQTNEHWRDYNSCNVNYKIENRLSLYLVTSKCFTFQSHHSKFIVSSISGLFLVFGCLILLCITLRTFNK